MQRSLTPAEVSDLLNRIPDLQRRVLLHERLFESGTWDQIKLNSLDHHDRLPIPPRGLAVRDDKYGTVVVFPDAAGQLHFSGDVTAASVDALNKPRFASPTGNTMEQFLADVRASLGTLVAGAVILWIVYLVVVKHV